MPSRWFVYAVRCRDGSIYTGITTDLARRIKTHNAGQGGAYTRSRKPVRLLFREGHATQSSALKREAQIKRWPRSQKLRDLRRAGCFGYSQGDGRGPAGRKSRTPPDPDDRRRGGFP